jgi:ATP-dependent metalloprotease
MDGFSERDNVIVIAATNLPETLDEALKRPGRFDKVIDIPMPDMKCRKDILDLYIGKIVHDASVDSSLISKGTTGFTGADLFNLVNMAMLNAVKEGRTECSANDIECAKDRILLGVANKSMIFTQEEKLKIAIHEVGHVLAIIFTEGAEPLHKTSILRRGNHFGKTTQMPENDRLSFTKKQALAYIDVKMAGKIMNELIDTPENASTQCESDLVLAAENAHRFIRTGMFNELFGLAFYAEKDDMGPEVKNKVDSSVNLLLQQSYNRVRNMLQDKVALGRNLSKILVEKETLTRTEVMEIIKNFKEG